MMEGLSPSTSNTDAVSATVFPSPGTKDATLKRVPDAGASALPCNEAKNTMGVNNTSSMSTQLESRVVVTLLHKDGLFSCQTCDMKTTSSKGFDEHIARHILAKPYVCLNCMVKFESKVETDKHAASVHKDEQLKCALLGIKKIGQIMTKLKQNGKYVFKGICRKNYMTESKTSPASINNYSTGSSTSVAGCGMSTSVAGSGISTLAGSGMSTSVGASGMSTSVASSGISSSVVGFGNFTSASGSGMSTSVSGSVMSTSDAGSGMSTSVAGSVMSTLDAGSVMSTSGAGSGMSTSVTGSGMPTSIVGSGMSTSIASLGISESFTNNEQIYDTVCQRLSYTSAPAAQETEISNKDLCNTNLNDSRIKSSTSKLENVFDILNASLHKVNNVLMPDNVGREKECETSSKIFVEPTNESQDTVQECEQHASSFTNKEHHSAQNAKAIKHFLSTEIAKIIDKEYTSQKPDSTIINQSSFATGKENMVNHVDQQNGTCLPSTAIEPQTVCKETGISKTLEEQTARKDKHLIISPIVNEMLRLKVKEMLSLQKNKQKKDSQVPLNHVTAASCVENSSRDKESVEKSLENNSREDMNCNNNVDDLNSVNSALEEVVSANLPSLYRNRRTTAPEKDANSTEKNKDCAVSLSHEKQNMSNINLMQTESFPASAAGQESRKQTGNAITSLINHKSVVTSEQSGLTNDNSAISEMLSRRSQADQRYLPGLVQPPRNPVGAHCTQSSHSLSSAEIGVNRIQAQNVTVQHNAPGQMVHTRRITMLEETVGPVNHFSSSDTPLYTNLPNNGNSQYLNSYLNQGTLQPMDVHESMPQANHTSTVSDRSNRNTRAVEPPRYPFPYGLPFIPTSLPGFPFTRAPGQAMQLPARSSNPMTTQSDIGSITGQRTDVLQNGQFFQTLQNQQQHNPVSQSVATTNPSCMYNGLRQPFPNHTGGQQQRIMYNQGNKNFPQQSTLSSQEYGNHQQTSAISNHGNGNIHQRQTVQGPESSQNLVNPRPGVQYQRQTLQGPVSNLQNVVNQRSGVDNVQQIPPISSKGGQRLIPFNSMQAYSNSQQMRVWYPPQSNFQQRPIYQQSELHMSQTGMLPTSDQTLYSGPATSMSQHPSILRRNYSRAAKSRHKHVSVSQGPEASVADQSCQTPIYNPESTTKHQRKKRGKSVPQTNTTVPEQLILDQFIYNTSPTFLQPSVSNQQGEGTGIQNILGQSQAANSTVTQTSTMSTLVNSELNTHQNKRNQHAEGTGILNILGQPQAASSSVTHTSTTSTLVNSELNTHQNKRNQQAEGTGIQNILGQSQPANSTVTGTTNMLVNSESNTHQNKRKQTLQTRECDDVQISSVEQNTTAKEVNSSETYARESLSCPDADLNNTVPSTKSGDASNSVKEVKSSGSSSKDLKGDCADLYEEKTDMNRNEKGKKNSKEKNLFTRVGSFFLCNICKIETESAVYFRKHVGMDIHFKKKICKKCSLSTSSENDFSNCQMVNIVMNGLRYGSAVTKKIKQEPDDVVSISSEDCEIKETESVVAEYLKNKSIMKTSQDKERKTEELTPIVVEEDDKGQITSSQNSDSGSVIYEGMVKTVGPLKMQIKVPQPYKSGEGNSKNKKTVENPSANQESVEQESAGTSKSTKVTMPSIDMTLEIKDMETTTSYGKTTYQKPTAKAKCRKETATGKTDHKGDNSNEGKTTLDVNNQSLGQQNLLPVEQNEEMSSARQNSQIDHGMAENKCVDQGRPSYAENNSIERNFYICGVDGCKYSCMSSTGYHDHLFIFHRFHDQYKCVHCGLISKRVDEHLRHLHSHLKSNNKYSVFVCAFNMCKYQSNVLKKFIDHFATFHRNEKTFVCFFCKESFSSVEKLKEHFQRNLLKFVQCPHCTVKYATRKIIVKHINEVHPGMSKKIKVNGQLVCQARGSNHFQQQLSVANRANTQLIEKPNDEKNRNNESPASEALGSCRQENNKENSSNSIDINQNISRVEEKSGSADVLLNQNSCAEESSMKEKEPDPSSSETPTKEKTKTNSKFSNRQCSICSFVGRTMELLKEHELVHQNNQQQLDKPFRCQVCPQGCETLKAFREHMNCHTGTNKLKILHCTICDFSTNIMEVLAAHLRSTHPSIAQDMDNHILTIEFQTSASLLVCQVCDFVTTFEMDFFCHKSEHEKEREREIFSSPNQKGVRKPFTIPAGENYVQPVSCSECSFKTRIRSHLIFHISKHATLTAVFDATQSNGARKCEDADREPRKEETQVGQTDKVNNKPRVIPSTEISNENRENLQNECSKEKQVEIMNVNHQEIQTEGFIEEVSHDTEVLKNHLENSQENKAVFLGSDYLQDKLQCYVVKINGPQESYHCKICRFAMKSKYQLHKHVLRHLNVWMFKCGYCDHKCLESTKLYQHIENCHVGLPYKHHKVGIVELKGRIQRGTKKLDEKLTSNMSASHVGRWVKDSLNCHDDVADHFSNDEENNSCSENVNLEENQQTEEIISLPSLDDSSSPQEGLSEDQCNKDKTEENKTAEDITVEDQTPECDISAEISLKDNSCQDITSEDDVAKEKSKLPMTSIYQHPKSMLGKTEMRVKLIKMGNIYKCSICGYKSSVQQALAIHVRLHKREAKFRCQKCSFLTTTKETLEQHMEHSHSNRDGSDNSPRKRTEIKEGSNKSTEDSSEEESSDNDTRPLTRSLEKNLLEEFGKKLRKNSDSQKMNQGSSAVPRERQNGMSMSPLRNLPGKEWVSSKFEEVNNGFKCLLCSRIYSSQGNVVKHIEIVCYKRKSVKRDFALFLRKKHSKNSGNKKALLQCEEVKTQNPLNLETQNLGSRQDDSGGRNKNGSRLVSNSWKSWMLSKIKEDGTSFRCRLCRYVSLYKHNVKRHITTAHRKDYNRSKNSQTSQQSLAVKKGRTKETKPRKETSLPKAKKSLNQGDIQTRPEAQTNASQRESGVIRKARKEEDVGKMLPRDEYFRCNGCKNIFKTFDEIQNHLAKECKEALYRCTLCRLYFSFNEHDVRRHSKLKHGHSTGPLLCRHSDRFRRYTVPQTKSSKTKSLVDKNTGRGPSVPLDYTQYQQESDCKVLSYSKNITGQIFCGKCRFMAANAQAFQHHCSSQHKHEAFTCAFCNEFHTLFLVNLRKHTQLKHPKCKNMKFYFDTSKEEVQPQARNNTEFSKRIYESEKDSSSVSEAGNVCTASTEDCIVCTQCNYSNSNLKNFQSHCYKKHTGMSLVCLHCNEYKCHTVVQMSNHCKKTHGLCKMKFAFSTPLVDTELKKISCILPNCGFVTMFTYVYRDHLYNHFNYTPYYCQYCSYKSRQKRLLKAHIKREHPRKSAKLFYHKKDYMEKKVQNLIAKSKKLQQEHVTNKVSSTNSNEDNRESKKGNGTISNTVSEIMSNAGEITDMRQVPKSYYRQKKYSNGNIKYHCLKCPAVYDIVPSITYHVQANHFPRDIKCRYCSLQFTSKFSFDKHMKQRHPGKPRQCLPPMTAIKSRSALEASCHKVAPNNDVNKVGSDEGEHTDIYSDDDDDSPKRKTGAVLVNVTSVKKRKFTKKAPSKRKLDLSSSEESSDDDDYDEVRKKPNKCSKSRRQSESDRLSSVGKLKKRVQPIETSSDESVAQIPNIRLSAKKRPRVLTSDDESITSSDSKNSDEELLTDSWYSCHMCSYSTNDLRYFSRHLVCHDTFTHFVTGEKVESPLIDNLNSGNLQNPLFLCSYCCNYEDSLPAMKQHRDRCHPFNVFDCTKVNQHKTEVLVNLQTKLKVEDICEFDNKKITQILEEQGIKKCPLIQDDSKNDSDSSEEESSVDVTRPCISRKRIEVSSISKYLKLAEHHGDKDRMGDNHVKVNKNAVDRHGDQDQLTSSSKHSLYPVNLPTGGLASIMEAYSELYEGSSEEDEDDMDDRILEQDLNLNKASNENLVQENAKACEVVESVESGLAGFEERSIHNTIKSSYSVEGTLPRDYDLKRNEAHVAFTSKESEKCVTEENIGCSDVSEEINGCSNVTEEIIGCLNVDNEVSDGNMTGDNLDSVSDLMTGSIDIGGKMTSDTIDRRDCHEKTTQETFEVTEHVKEYTDIEGKGTGDTTIYTDSEVNLTEDNLEHVSDNVIGYTGIEETVMDTVVGCLEHDGEITEDASVSVSDFEEMETDTLNGCAAETTEGTEEWRSDDVIKSVGNEEMVKDAVRGYDQSTKDAEESVLDDMIGYAGSEETVTGTVIGCAEETKEVTEETVLDMIGYVGSEETVKDSVIGCAEVTTEGAVKKVSDDIVDYLGSEETVTDSVIGCAEVTTEGTEEIVLVDRIGYVGSEETVTDSVIGCAEVTTEGNVETVLDDMIGYVGSEETLTDSVIGCTEVTTEGNVKDIIGYVGSEETVTDSVIGCTEVTTDGNVEAVSDAMIGYVGFEETVTDSVIGCNEVTTEGTVETVSGDMIGYVGSEETVTDSVIGCIEVTAECTVEAVLENMIGYVDSEETVTDSVIGCMERTTEGTVETLSDDMIGCEEIVTDRVMGRDVESVSDDIIGHVENEETLMDPLISCAEETIEGIEKFCVC